MFVFLHYIFYSTTRIDLILKGGLKHVRKKRKDCCEMHRNYLLTV